MWVTTCLGLLMAVHAQSQPQVDVVYPENIVKSLPNGEKLVYGIIEHQKPSPTQQRDFYADQNDCRTFYRQDVGKPPLRFKCPVGSVFEETQSSCVDSSQSTRPKCRLTTQTVVYETIPSLTAEQSIPEILTAESTASGQIIANQQSLTSNPHLTLQTKIVDPVVNELQEGVITCSGPGVFAVEGDCAAFYSCVGDLLPSFATCQEGKVFEGPDCVNPQESSRPQCRKEDPYKGQALPLVDRPKTVVRLDPPSTHIIQIPTSPVEKKNSLLRWDTGVYYSPDLFADKTNCHIFYRQLAGYATPHRFICPVGLVFEETLSVCVQPYLSTRAECIDSSDTIQRSLQEYIADENNCYIYHRNMADGRVIDFECPVGTVFEESLSTCVHPFESTRPDCTDSLGRQLSVL